jgi:hypothetical protein
MSLDGIKVEANMVVDDRSAGASIVPLGSLPPNVNLTAYHLLSNGAQLLSFDSAIQLPGLSLVESRDIVRFDGTNYSLQFSGAGNGVPPGVRIDAVTVAQDGNLVLSFNSAVDLAGIVADRRDLLLFRNGSWSLFFAGALAGVASDLDLDAADLLSNGHLLLSFDGSGSVGGVAFDDEDVLEYAPESNTWRMFWDGSTRQASFVVANLDAFCVIPGQQSGMFSDGFESGDLLRWSAHWP